MIGGTWQVESRTEQFKQRHRAALTAAMENIGGRVEDSLAERISDAYPPASSPGESPHRRTGALRAGVGHATEETDSSVRETIYSGREGGDPAVPAYLEGGTTKMLPRPYMAPERDAWAAALPTELPQELLNYLASG